MYALNSTIVLCKVQWIVHYILPETKGDFSDDHECETTNGLKTKKNKTVQAE